MNDLADRLKYLREKKQISMDKMCQDLKDIYCMNLAKSTISKWENGKAEPSLAYARVLTKYFDVTLDYILGLETKENKPKKNIQNINEIKLLSDYNKLNNLGKEKALERVDELTQIDKYTVDRQIDTIAAHNEHLHEEGEIEKIKQDLDDMDNW
ncbi:TPA: helix-turn-helix transcriptional regulator [Clostridioides difficile]|nr:helix-turn-helix transcriptional regulator [Clostridioides difficile]HBF3756691.1 helix-turn-helix transcriptional regulator [Clostridioides difficile]HBF6247028.1 helix-turn-helix transcriptional regulator [Clostridioides difficile]HBY3218597.1 helix-turn-helix transcriptional regulator [Clostridioides difficile]